MWKRETLAFEMRRAGPPRASTLGRGPSGPPPTAAGTEVPSLNCVWMGGKADSISSCAKLGMAAVKALAEVSPKRFAAAARRAAMMVARRVGERRSARSIPRRALSRRITAAPIEPGGLMGLPSQWASFRGFLGCVARHGSPDPLAPQRTRAVTAVGATVFDCASACLPPPRLPPLRSTAVERQLPPISPRSS
jgi:hypothetical protein